MDSVNKKKIVNDPVHGFINIQHPLVFDLIEHPWFQRLRNIRQLGLTFYVYPGANHTRFQHALGALHLMNLAITVLRSKGHCITDEEAEAASVAILLHDIGHGPFSHTLEFSLAQGISHENISRIMMQWLNVEFNNKLQLAIDVFEDKYPKHFLHQLVSSQLDVDRLDYLSRDSYFSGVTEGTIGLDRIIKMLEVVDDQLVIEAKGIYSIEKFLIARRLMYWQVYLHKTVVVADQMLVKLLQRARELTFANVELFATPALYYFLKNTITPENFEDYGLNKQPPTALSNFVKLDDNDILIAAKVWCDHSDFVLSRLAQNLINRKLLKIEFKNQPLESSKLTKLKADIVKRFPEFENYIDYFVFADSVSNNAYSPTNDLIKIIYNNGDLKDITEASDMLNTQVLSKEVKKYILCYPK